MIVFFIRNNENTYHKRESTHAVVTKTKIGNIAIYPLSHIYPHTNPHTDIYDLPTHQCTHRYIRSTHTPMHTQIYTIYPHTNAHTDIYDLPTHKCTHRYIRSTHTPMHTQIYTTHMCCQSIK